MILRRSCPIPTPTLSHQGRGGLCSVPEISIELNLMAVTPAPPPEGEGFLCSPGEGTKLPSLRWEGLGEGGRGS